MMYAADSPSVPGVRSAKIRTVAGPAARDPTPEDLPMVRLAPALTAALALLATLALAPDAGAEEVINPIYKSWAGHKPGTTITMKTTTPTAQGRIEVTVRYKLIKLEPSKAVIESVTTSDTSGKAVESPPERFEIRRMFPLLPGVKKEQVGKPSGAVAKGEETITLVGKEYKAQWYDTKGRTEAGESIARTWMAEDFPGMVLKEVTRVPSTNKVTTRELVEFKAP